MRILGTGSAVPDLVVKNDDIATFLDTSDEWIRSRTGIVERRIHEGNFEEIVARAAQNAMDDAKIKAEDLDLILCSNLYNKYMTPALSCVIQGMIGATCPCLDLNGACAGFIYALEAADAYLARGRYARILVISAEENSRIVDWTDRSTCVLFGDAAAAAVVGPMEGEFLFEMTTNSNTEFLNAYNSPGNCPFEKTDREHKGIYMNGQEVYKFAVQAATSGIKSLCEKSEIGIDDVDWFILHQANYRIVDAVRMRLKQPKEKFPYNGDKYGNTSSASIPLLLDELNKAGKLKKGQRIAMSAFGAGLVTGACMFTWQ